MRIVVSTQQWYSESTFYLLAIAMSELKMLPPVGLCKCSIIPNRITTLSPVISWSVEMHSVMGFNSVPHQSPAYPRAVYASIELCARIGTRNGARSFFR